MSEPLPAVMARGRYILWKAVTLHGSGMALAVLLVLYLVLGLLYNQSAPFPTRPDEPWHAAYVKYLHDYHALPVVDLSKQGLENRSPEDMEGHQPPLYYALVGLLTDKHDFEGFDRLYTPNPHIFGTVWGNRNLFLPQRSQAYALLYKGRFLSLAFGLVTLLAAFGSVRIFASSSTALLTTAFIAFNPEFLFISTSFSNDLCVVAISSVALWLTVSGIGQPLRLWRACVAGIVIGLAALAKLSGLLFVVVPVIIVLLERFTWHKRDEPASRVITYLSVLVSISLLIPLPWFVRNWQVYGDPFAISALQNIMGRRLGLIPLQQLCAFVTFLWKGYWLDFSQGGLVYGPPWLYWGYGILLACSVVGLVVAWRKLTRERPYLVLSLAWIAVFSAALLLTMVQTVNAMGGGRLLFPVSVSLSELVAVGILGLWPQRWRTPLSLLLIGVSVSSALFAWARILRPTYNLRSLPMSEAVGLPNHESIRLGSAIVLDGWEISTRDVRPGDLMVVTLYWHTDEPIAKNYDLFLQLWPLASGSCPIFRGLESYPGLGTFPTSRWPTDKILVDPYPLPVKALTAIEEPVGFELVMGLFELATMQRLAVTRDGITNDHVTLGRITIRPSAAVTMPEAARLPNPVRFDTGIQLMGWQLSKHAGGELCLDLWWQGADAPRQDLTVFVHALSSGGQLVSQADGPPRQGQFPTSLWKAQDIVRDQHCFSQSSMADASALVVGLYELANLQRLAAYDLYGSRMPNDAVVLKVEP